MKHYRWEMLFLILQLYGFYGLPLFAESTDIIGMVTLTVFLTFVLSILMGAVSNNKGKYLYPVLVGLCFLPSVFMFYNESAFVYVLYYAVISSVGMGIGLLIKKLIGKR